MAVEERMATKQDLKAVEERMATKQDLKAVEERMATKQDQEVWRFVLKRPRRDSNSRPTA
ncbi:hypothetical protein BLX87_00005 [Bacillus sp. VT-16-64]|nr:hypothetical protein BLX87_00005 [Bacillus sp. VT-16-64]